MWLEGTDRGDSPTRAGLALKDAGELQGGRSGNRCGSRHGYFRIAAFQDATPVGYTAKCVPNGGSLWQYSGQGHQLKLNIRILEHFPLMLIHSLRVERN
jgi:hypothetical protein